MSVEILDSGTRCTGSETELVTRRAGRGGRELRPLELGHLAMFPAHPVTFEGEVAEAKQLNAERDQRNAPEEQGGRARRHWGAG